jgi:hypothetical protein
MQFGNDLQIGITGIGVMHRDPDEFDIDTRFRMVKECGAFDYYEKSPAPGEIDSYLRARDRYQLPVRSGSYYYVLGRDEPLLEWHLRVAKQLGSVVQNIQIMTHDIEGRFISDQQIADVYLWAASLGDKLGVTPCLEIHVNMWSENFARVSRVGKLVEDRGVKFNITLDHSHVIFKMDNPPEQEVQGLRAEIDAGAIELDPFKPGHVISTWIDKNYVRHAHARAAVPANPINLWAKHPDGSYGRGIQYPFVRPCDGEWHSPWDAERLQPWKEVIRQLFRFHGTHAESCFGQITTEFIPFPDYGSGARYSIFENNIACARWIRETWIAMRRDNQFVNFRRHPISLKDRPTDKE